jgi:hypothetical protein
MTPSENRPEHQPKAMSFRKDYVRYLHKCSINQSSSAFDWLRQILSPMRVVHSTVDQSINQSVSQSVSQSVKTHYLIVAQLSLEFFAVFQLSLQLDAVGRQLLKLPLQFP